MVAGIRLKELKELVAADCLSDFREMFRMYKSATTSIKLLWDVPLDIIVFMMMVLDHKSWIKL